MKSPPVLISFYDHEKDSGRSSRRGKHKGYFFMRDDYVRLKVLAYTVHKDAVGGILSRFD